MVRLTTLAAALAAIVSLILAPVVLAQAGQPATEQVEAMQSAIEWLLAQENADGGYTSFSAGAGQAPSDVGGTLDATLALAAAGSDQVAGPDVTPSGYLFAHAEELQAYTEANPGQAGKAVMAVAAAGQDPRDFAGIDLVSILSQQIADGATFESRTPIEIAYALLGFAAAGETPPEAAVEWLRARQAADGEFAGAWDDGFGTAGSVDATSLAVMALIAAATPAGDESIERATAFLQSAQLPSAEWPYAPGLPGSANSTALAIQALAAQGEEIAGENSAWSQEGASPVDALISWQGASGAFQAELGQGREDSFFATVQAVPALLGQPYPLPAQPMTESAGREPVEATAAPETGAAEEARAGLVVVLGENELLTRCVPFPEPDISGLELLERSGLDIETQVQGAGALTCQIEGVGCPADDCFCQCEGGGEDCQYWSYWQQQDGDWQYAVAGATQSQVTDGAVEGWVWGSGAEGEAPAPPSITFASICEAGTANSGSPSEGNTDPLGADPDEAQNGEPAAVATVPAANRGWWTYAAFVAIVVALGLLAWFVRRRSHGV